MSHIPHHDYQFTVIGDVLLHSATTSKPIQVVVQSTTSIPSVTRVNSSTPPTVPNLVKKMLINRAVPSDLENTSNSSVSTSQRAMSAMKSKKIIRVHQIGWKLVKEWKTKIMTINATEPEKSIAAKVAAVERTYF